MRKQPVCRQYACGLCNVWWQHRESRGRLWVSRGAVDGMDVEAIMVATGCALERARRGDGPSLLECQAYRYQGHFTAERALGSSIEPMKKSKAGASEIQSLAGQRNSKKGGYWEHRRDPNWMKQWRWYSIRLLSMHGPVHFLHLRRLLTTCTQSDIRDFQQGGVSGTTDKLFAGSSRGTTV